MELLQLEYFVKVATLQSISKAAQNLHVSQSSLSQTISHLEKELGAQLFDRVGRNIILNERGKIFLEGVQFSLKELDNVTANVRSLAGSFIGHLSLGIFASPYLISDCINQYATNNPHVNFSVTTNLTTRDRYNLSDFDLVIYHSNPLFDDFMEIPILYEDQYVILPRDHPLSQRAFVYYRDLRDETFVSFSVSSNSMEPNLRYCAENIFKPKIKYYTDSTLMRRIFIEKGAVGFVTASSLKDIQNMESLAAVPVADAARDVLCIGWHKGLKLTPTAQNFKEFILEHFRVGQG